MALVGLETAPKARPPVIRQQKEMLEKTAFEEWIRGWDEPPSDPLILYSVTEAKGGIGVSTAAFNRERVGKTETQKREGLTKRLLMGSCFHPK